MYNTEIITVNYNTPDLIDELIKSIRKNEGNYKIRVIDGSDEEPFISEIQEICENDKNTILEQQGWNIHHGRGMDLGVSTSNYEWCLVLDSDKAIQQPIIKRMHEAANIGEKDIVSFYCYVNKDGENKSDRNYSELYPIKYYHPSFFMIKTEFYLKLKKKGISFIHHPCPSIKIMNYLHENDLTNAVGVDICEYLNIEYPKLIELISKKHKGTRERFGDNY